MFRIFAHCVLCGVHGVEIVAFIEKKVSEKKRIQWGRGHYYSTRIKLCPCPRFTEGRKVKLLRIKGILARVHFCEIPLRSGRVELRWLRW